METQILFLLVEKSGLSQRDFANKINLPESRISEWLRGVRNPKISKLKEIAEVFGFEIVLSFELRPK